MPDGQAAAGQKTDPVGGRHRSSTACQADSATLHIQAVNLHNEVSNVSIGFLSKHSFKDSSYINAIFVPIPNKPLEFNVNN